MTDKMVKPVKTAKVAKTPKTEKATKAPKHTRIFFILDRSGSMSSIVNETIGGFNAFVNDQKEVPGKASLSLVQFDHQCQIVHDNVKLSEVPELDFNTFKPRGMTALYDAVGVTLSRFKDDNPKGTKTIVAILTDGAENSSKEYDFNQVNRLITEVQNEKGWEVLFIGANMDAKSVATSMGIKLGNSVTFDYTSKGASDATSAINLATRAMRGQSFNYADGSIACASTMDMGKMYGDVAKGTISPEMIKKQVEDTKTPKSK